MKNTIRILGASGSKSIDLDQTCIQITPEVIIDAGNILYSLGDESRHINHIFITHAHLDHLADLPFFIDSFFESRDQTLHVYATSETIQIIKKNIFNWEIWPDFSEIKLTRCDDYAVTFHPIRINQTVRLKDCSLKAIQNNHTSSSCGYVIAKNEESILLTSDTYCCRDIWDEVNENLNIKAVMVDVSFPSRFDKLAFESKHLTPKLLHEELKYLKRDDVKIMVNHLKPYYINEIIQELDDYEVLLNNGSVMQSEDIIDLSSCVVFHNIHSKKRQIQKLNEIGSSLSGQKDINQVMNKVLKGAKQLCKADAGTIYLMSEDEQYLQFSIVQTSSLELSIGGEDENIRWENLALYDEKGDVDITTIAARCATKKTMFNIQDVYAYPWKDFEGPKSFDDATGYQTQSMLLVPMINQDGDVIGVMQLINKLDEKGNIIEFSPEDEDLILSMASQVAVSISNTKLIADLENFLDAYMESIATIIEKKSKHTSGHIKNVVQISSMIAEAINKSQGTYKHKFFNSDELKQLKIAAWMHDIGKITTPEHIINKSSKLQKVMDSIELIQVRFELYKKELEIDYLKDVISLEHYEEQLQNTDQDLKFIEIINLGNRRIDDEEIQRIHTISQKTLTLNGVPQPLLHEDEVYNLSVLHGTLNKQEREVINEHAQISIDILESLPFPKRLRNVPKIAGAHHEKLCGGGYPKNLHGKEISFESRILAIADIFEAILAHDRPYKKANTLNTAMGILHDKALKNEIDAELLKFIVDNNLHIEYVVKNLDSSQLDEVTVDFSIL
ncbi:MAG: HD domain-containing phosphohydrolase [Campylobacterota bacterium]|nr:HD domain-containing phosphohydrolase [Campylobacterota bacterium]